MKCCIAILASLISLKTMASLNTESEALTMVPKGKIISNQLREYTLKTTSGTKIKLEFELSGKFQEASGINLNKGDEFEPGHGLLSLSTVAKKLVKRGRKVKGDWNLEKDPLYGWIYEIAVDNDGETIFDLIEAKNGSFFNLNAGSAPKAQMTTSNP